MTSSASFTPSVKRGGFDFANPFALMLTHRRGGAVLVCVPAGLRLASVSKLGSVQSEYFSGLGDAVFEGGTLTPTQQSLLCGLEHSATQPTDASQMPSSSGAAVRWQTGPGFALGLSQSTTAEHLSSMYERALATLAVTDSELKSFILGIGPGSFTGLRLGAAFANGLQLGMPRACFSVPCARSADMAAWAGRVGYVSETFNPDAKSVGFVEEYSTLVSLEDVYAAVCALGSQAMEQVEVFMPAYGRDPSPVLKLREALSKTDAQQSVDGVSKE